MHCIEMQCSSTARYRYKVFYITSYSYLCVPQLHLLVPMGSYPHYTTWSVCTVAGETYVHNPNISMKQIESSPSTSTVTLLLSHALKLRNFWLNFDLSFMRTNALILKCRLCLKLNSENQVESGLHLQQLPGCHITTC